jgi:hypothetical protein
MLGIRAVITKKRLLPQDLEDKHLFLLADQ